MTESPEREEYRMRCKYYREISGHCSKQSGSYGKRYPGFPYSPPRYFLDINCTPDTNCPRMKRYDKMHKQGKEAEK